MDRGKKYYFRFIASASLRGRLVSKQLANFSSNIVVHLIYSNTPKLSHERTHLLRRGASTGSLALDTARSMNTQLDASPGFPQRAA